MKWIIEDSSPFHAYRIAPDLWLIRLRSVDEELFIYFDSAKQAPIWAAFHDTSYALLKTWGVDKKEFKSFMSARRWEDEDRTMIPDQFLAAVAKALHHATQFVAQRLSISGNHVIASVKDDGFDWMLVVDSRYNPIDHDGNYLSMFYDYAAHMLRKAEMFG